VRSLKFCFVSIFSSQGCGEQGRGDATITVEQNHEPKVFFGLGYEAISAFLASPQKPMQVFRQEISCIGFCY
jgi:hypothetical protein